MVEKFMIEKSRVEKSGVEKFMVEISEVEKFLLTLGLLSPDLKLGVEMSCFNNFSRYFLEWWNTTKNISSI